ncbi:MAG TPA: TlpA disulfide reductase family protein [Elusimicrobiota bacterium]|jgi:peroxiredoxin|nr:TlpA disulfide reductase family protein [Elusimicrobiota bacterium]
MRKRLLAALLASGLAACGPPLRQDVPTAPVPAPDFALKDLSGATVRLSDYRGRTVLLDFWATWCAPCKQSIPRYIDMLKRLRSKGFEVIGIAEDDNPPVVRAYALAHGMDYPVLADSGTELFRKYGGQSLPTCYLIDDQGAIRGRWQGFDAATGIDVERATDVLLHARPHWRWPWSRR